MGTTTSPIMLFDLTSLIAPIDGLDFLAAPISHDEIDNVINTHVE
jgi:hypothetical protein